MFLEVKNIAFSYDGRRKVLDDISFNLPKGETIAIVGASGCGKSTLLRLVSGILTTRSNYLSQGEIVIDGISANEYRKSGKLAFMFQEATLLPNLTVRQNIEFPLRIKNAGSPAKVDELLKKVGLSEFADYLPKQLSGGMKTRVSLARSFVTRPELLLLDEPFSALDIAWKAELYKELNQLKELGTTVIVVTHDVQEAILLSNKVMALNRFGKIQPPIHAVTSERSLPDRVQDISAFLLEANYQQLFVEVQDAILKDGKRRNITRSEVVRIIEHVIQCAGKEREESSLSKSDLDAIRDYSNDGAINTMLLNAYRKAQTQYLKYQLIRDILEYNALPISIHEELFSCYFAHLSAFSAYSKEWYAQYNDKCFFEILKGRIASTKGSNPKKKWIYICDLYGVNRSFQLSNFLQQIIDGRVEHVNFDFAKEVAKKVKSKIDYETKANISVV